MPTPRQVQVDDLLENTAADLGARRLLAAILLDAVAHLEQRGTKAAAEAERWIRTPEAKWAPFSFAMICDALGLDAAYLARGLLERRMSAAADGGVRLPGRRTLAAEGPRRIVLARRRRRWRAPVATGA